MKILGKREKTVLVGIKCDVCGGDCRGDSDKETHGDIAEYATLSARWGYFSGKDLEQHECHFCEECFDRVVEFIETIGGKVRKREYHPGEAIDQMVRNIEDFKLEETEE